MNFNWDKFTEYDYEKYAKNSRYYDDWIGAIYVGDICIEILISSCENDTLDCNFYTAHEDTGYGYKNDNIAYDYAGSITLKILHNLSYNEFKIKAEHLFMEHIKDYKGTYSLVEHANRPLFKW